MNLDQALQLVTDKLRGWLETLIGLLPNIVVALLLMALAWLMAHLLRRLVLRIAERASMRNAMSRLLGTVTFLTVIGIGLFVALGVLRLDKTVTSLLAGAGVLGLALGFAAQSMAADILSGTVISLRRPYAEGDLIQASDHFGTVERISLRVTTLKTPEGQVALIPNRNIVEQSLINYSKSRPRRVDVPVGVTYDADLEQVARVARQTIEGLSDRQPGSEVEVFFTEFGDSSINLVVRFWIPVERQAKYLAARSEAIVQIKRSFDAEGIGIPFPIRTLDLDPDLLATLSDPGSARTSPDSADSDPTEA